jgi:hypothetical protein
MIHETYECDRCHRKLPKDQTHPTWDSAWREYTFMLPRAPRQAEEAVTVLCCTGCANFLEAHMRRFATDASKDAVIAALFK